MDKIKVFADIVGFLESYPLWLRLVLGAWVLLTGALLALLILVPRSESLASSEPDKPVSPPTSHFEAAEQGLLALDCAPYQMKREPSFSTLPGRICAALAEARNNVLLLAKWRDVVLKGRNIVPEASLSYKQLRRYLTSEFREEPYGPRQQSLLRLLDMLERNAVYLLPRADAADVRHQLAAAEMTVDDQLTANGFLDWVISHIAKKDLQPADIHRFGPYFEQPFPETMRPSLRHFPADGDALTYQDVLTAYD